MSTSAVSEKYARGSSGFGTPTEKEPERPGVLSVSLSAMPLGSASPPTSADAGSAEPSSKTRRWSVSSSSTVWARSHDRGGDMQMSVVILTSVAWRSTSAVGPPNRQR